MTDRDADLVVADDAEIEGRHDVAAELRARHLSAEEQLVESYRMRLGLLPWATHAAQMLTKLREYRQYRPDLEADRGTGRTTRALLRTLARCELESVDLLMIVGGMHVRDHCSYAAREMHHRLRLQGIVVKTASDRSPHLLYGLRPHVVYRDHADLEFPMRKTSRASTPPG